jgi:AmmeMemoRadiSam system protein B
MCAVKGAISQWDQLSLWPVAIGLPFLQVLLKSFAVVPLLVGKAEPKNVADVLRRLWSGPETLIIVSSDLSHYHDYETARHS